MARQPTLILCFFFLQVAVSAGQNDGPVSFANENRRLEGYVKDVSKLTIKMTFVAKGKTKSEREAQYKASFQIGDKKWEIWRHVIESGNRNLLVIGWLDSAGEFRRRLEVSCDSKITRDNVEKLLAILPTKN